MELVTSVTVDLDDLMDDLLRYLDQDELVEFFTELDMLMADWSFTEQMYKYFKAQHKIFKAEL